MKLLIVRHAVAEEWEDWDGSDADRPLTEKGRERFNVAAQYISQACPTLGTILTSPYVRARETARILEAASPNSTYIENAILEPGVPSEARIDFIAKLGAETLAVIGHEPGLSDLAAKLLGGQTTFPFTHLKKGSLLALQIHGRVVAGSAQLICYLPPRVMRDAREGHSFLI